MTISSVGHGTVYDSDYLFVYIKKKILYLVSDPYSLYYKNFPQRFFLVSMTNRQHNTYIITTTKSFILIHWHIFSESL